jgi:hypothetical protein
VSSDGLPSPAAMTSQDAACTQISLQAQVNTHNIKMKVTYSPQVSIQAHALPHAKYTPLHMQLSMLSGDTYFIPIKELVIFTVLFHCSPQSL